MFEVSLGTAVIYNKSLSGRILQSNDCIYVEILFLLEWQSNGQEQESPKKCDIVGGEYVHFVAKKDHSPGNFGHQRRKKHVEWPIHGLLIRNHLQKQKSQGQL